MFVSALLQYNSGINAVSTNARLRWEYQPGSELFVVYNEERNTLSRSFPALEPRVHRQGQPAVPVLGLHLRPHARRLLASLVHCVLAPAPLGHRTRP